MIWKLVLFGSLLLVVRALLPHRMFTFALIALGSGMLIPSAFMLYGWARLDVRGEIIDAQTRCDQSNTTRCETIYKIRAISGEEFFYETGFAPSFARDLPIGAIVDKRQWRFRYLVDGNVFEYVPLLSQCADILVGIAMLARGAQRHRAATTKPSHPPARAIV